MKTNIIVNLQVEGFHCWPKAPSEVSFLRERHRHMFHICCKKQVSHDDRDIEIILFKRAVFDYIRNDMSLYPSRELAFDFGHMSCEMIAKELTEHFKLSYCSVLEDGENGAEVIG